MHSQHSDQSHFINESSKGLWSNLYLLVKDTIKFKHIDNLSILVLLFHYLNKQYSLETQEQSLGSCLKYLYNLRTYRASLEQTSLINWLRSAVELERYNGSSLSHQLQAYLLSDFSIPLKQFLFCLCSHSWLLALTFHWFATRQLWIRLQGNENYHFLVRQLLTNAYTPTHLTTYCFKSYFLSDFQDI